MPNKYSTHSGNDSAYVYKLSNREVDQHNKPATVTDQDGRRYVIGQPSQKVVAQERKGGDHKGEGGHGRGHGDDTHEDPEKKNRPQRRNPNRPGKAANDDRGGGRRSPDKGGRGRAAQKENPYSTKQKMQQTNARGKYKGR
jgi:hypothetical protein